MVLGVVGFRVWGFRVSCRGVNNCESSSSWLVLIIL